MCLITLHLTVYLSDTGITLENKYITSTRLISKILHQLFCICLTLPIPDDMDGKVIMDMLVKRKSPTYISAKIYHQKIQMKKIREKLIKAKYKRQ